VTTSETSPAWSVTSTVSGVLTSSMLLVSLAVLKPDFSTVIEYWPTGSEAKE